MESLIYLKGLRFGLARIHRWSESFRKISERRTIKKNVNKITGRIRERTEAAWLIQYAVKIKVVVTIKSSNTGCK